MMEEEGEVVEQWLFCLPQVQWDAYDAHGIDVKYISLLLLALS